MASRELRAMAGAVALLLAGMAGAQEPLTAPARDAVASVVAAAGQGTRGSVTNLPLPRYVSLKSSEGNARRGPSQEYRIDWVFRRNNMPLRVTAEYGHWRRVEDRDGAGGWVHYSLLSGVRTVLVVADMVDLRLRPDPETAVIARAEAGVIAHLGECEADWCRITADGNRGWVRKAEIWGADADELRN